MGVWIVEMRVLILGTSLILVLTGCRSVHSGLSQADFDRKIQDRFCLGMSSSETQRQLDRLSIEYRAGENIVLGLVYPQWSPIPFVNSFGKTYGMHPLKFSFDDDGQLVDLIYEPKHDIQHRIELEDCEEHS